MHYLSVTSYELMDYSSINMPMIYRYMLILTWTILHYWLQLSKYKSADSIVDKSVIRVGMATITASLCVQCLCVCIDRHLDMKKQVSQTISACSFYLRNINHIGRAILARENEAGGSWGQLVHILHVNI